MLRKSKRCFVLCVVALSLFGNTLFASVTEDFSTTSEQAEASVLKKYTMSVKDTQGVNNWYDVCEIIEMFDNHKITVDEEEDVVKIFQSVIFNTDIDYYGKQIEGIREYETKVIRPEYKLKKKGDTEEKEKMKDAEKSLKEFLKKFENKNEEITEKDAILV